MASSGETVIALVDVVKSYNKSKAVDGINLEINRGEFVVIMGPSGCGKTTTLRMIAGLETPDSGEIMIEGRRVNDIKPWFRDTPLVWQNFALFPHLNVFQNVEYGLRMRNLPKTERLEKVSRILHTVGLQGFEDRSVLKLSGGQKQRVGLARALVLDPKVLLLDEPLGALDAKIARSMQQELRRLHQLVGITFVYVTHNQSEAMALADRIVVMNDGKVQQAGKPNEIFRKPRNQFVAEFTGANNIFFGTVVDIAKEDLTISTSDGEFSIKGASNMIYSLNQCITFVVGADRVEFADGNQPTKNNMSGRVTAVEIIGSVVTIYVSAASSELQVHLSASEYAKSKIEVGKCIRLTWKKEDAYILP